MDSHDRGEPPHRPFTWIFLRLYAAAQSGSVHKSTAEDKRKQGPETAKAARGGNHRPQKPAIARGLQLSGKAIPGCRLQPGKIVDAKISLYSPNRIGERFARCDLAPIPGCGRLCGRQLVTLLVHRRGPILGELDGAQKNR